MGSVNGGKAQLVDAGSHVPLIVWGPPSIPQGTVCDDLIDVVDLFPTFCELSGTAIPSDIAIDGRSIAAQIHGRQGVQRTWTHQGLSEKETLFDGSWRVWRRPEKILDARELPLERTPSADDRVAQAASEQLNALFKKITPDGPRPAVPFAE